MTMKECSVLIVDDNVSLARSFARILKAKGYQTDTAESGMEAIEKVKEKESGFNLILMDVKMPVMNGVETYKEIKKVSPETAVIMMTAYSVDDLIQEALEEGAYAALDKPLDVDKVISLIERCLSAHNGAMILVTDDDVNLLRNFKRVLEAQGYLVGTAETGEQAIKMAAQETYDIIFVDMKLPTLNGLEVYLKIKEINPGVVAIMITGYREEMAELVKRALDNSAYACLYKPFEMREVVKMVGEICRSKTIGN